jgi:hypothetical protein
LLRELKPPSGELEPLPVEFEPSALDPPSPLGSLTRPPSDSPEKLSLSLDPLGLEESFVLDVPEPESLDPVLEPVPLELEPD